MSVRVLYYTRERLDQSGSLFRFGCERAALDDKMIATVDIIYIYC